MRTMPTIELELSEKEFSRLQEEYRKAALAMLQSLPDTSPPAFEQWLSQILQSAHTAQEDHAELNGILTFTAIEKFVFNLHRRGFILAHPGETDKQQEHSLHELAQSAVNDLQLPQHYVKRIQDLLTHFSKTTKELVDAAHISLTSRSRAALIEAYRQLVERTEKAGDHLGSERAIGRVEGAAAMLVSLEVMDRDTAKKKTDEFKIKARTAFRPK
jgi:hypothetical protein